MGQHKYNPTAIAKEKGEIPPKPPKKSKREREQEIYAKMFNAIATKILRGNE